MSATPSHRHERDIPTAAAAGALLAVSALHLYWSAGGRRASAGVVPTVDGRPTLAPSVGATRAVAVALAGAAVLYVGSSRRWKPVLLHRSGSFTAGMVLIARAVGNGSTVGLTKTVRSTTFARNDDRVFTPLCVLLGLAGVRAAARSASRI
jgi:hypothetical protein